MLWTAWKESSPIYVSPQILVLILSYLLVPHSGEHLFGSGSGPGQRAHVQTVAGSSRWFIPLSSHHKSVNLHFRGSGLSQKVIDEFRAFGSVMDNLQEEITEHKVNENAEIMVICTRPLPLRSDTFARF